VVVETARGPLGAFGLIARTVRLLAASFGFLFPIAFVPALALSLVSYLTGVSEAGADPMATGLSAALVLSLTLDLLVGFVVTGVMCLAAIDAVIGKRHTIGEYVGQTLRHLGPIIFLGVLLYVLAGIGLALFVIPGLYILARFLPWVAAIVFEDAGWSGLTRAQELTEGYRWPLVGTLLLFMVAGISVAFLMAPVIALATQAGGLVLAIVEAAATALYYALIAVFTALVYARLRELREGMSVEAIAASIE
jgi:hypothetical protein